jgi:cbb3-type cytochrome oxidase maturation protein
MVAAVAALFWAVNSGQYEDLEEASRTVLEADEPGTDESVAEEAPVEPRP